MSNPQSAPRVIGPAHLHTADVTEWKRHYTTPRYHALLCDAPYHLTSITERFSDPDAAPAKNLHNGRNPYASGMKGFMGQEWDGGDVAFRPETWARLKDHLYPGAICFAFAGTRGYHRMAAAIEDAGFIILPACVWIFASGMPKATRADSQIDRAAGAERIRTGVAQGAGSQNTNSLGPYASEYEATRAGTPLGRQWEGHRYGGQVLKPSLEMIACFQKPFDGPPIDGMTTTGAGALNVDAGRIATNDDISSRSGYADNPSTFNRSAVNRQKQELSGRWPSNLILDENAAPGIDAMSGITKSVPRVSTGNRTHNMDFHMTDGSSTYNDTGGASRFYHNTDWNAETIEAIDESPPYIYQAKASTSERNAGLAGFEERQLRTTTDKAMRDKNGNDSGPARANIHPTVKPISLCKYLASLLLPPPAYGPRRLLIPFSGSGSEICGAMLAGWEHITGIEQSDEYNTIAAARAAYWQINGHKLGKGKSAQAQDAPPAVVAGLFDE